MTYELVQPVFFVGFMGAGKTSVCRLLARELDVAAIDLDDVVAEVEGRSIPDIFDDSGEDAFRAMEAEALRRIARAGTQLVACGGGVVVRPENVEIMKSAGLVVYLEVSASEAALRVGDDPSRPLFGDTASVQMLLSARRALYEQAADVTIDTSGLDVAAVASTVRSALVAHDALRPCATQLHAGSE